MYSLVGYILTMYKSWGGGGGAGYGRLYIGLRGGGGRRYEIIYGSHGLGLCHKSG